MATITIRDLDDETKQRLRVRAARNGRSMEAEARAVLDAAVREEPRAGTGTRIHELLSEFEAELGGLLPARTAPPRPAEFGTPEESPGR